MRRHTNKNATDESTRLLLVPPCSAETETQRPLQQHKESTTRSDKSTSVNNDNAKTSRENVFLQRLFAEYDKRKRGSLNVSEVTGAMRAAGYPVNERQVLNLLAEIPEDRLVFARSSPGSRLSAAPPSERPLKDEGPGSVADDSDAGGGILGTIRKSLFPATSRKNKWRKAEVDFKGFRRLVTLWSRASTFLAVEHDQEMSALSSASLQQQQHSSSPPPSNGRADASYGSMFGRATLQTKHTLPDSGVGFAWQCVCLIVATYFVIGSTSMHIFDTFGLVRAFATTTVPDVMGALVCFADVAMYFFFAARVRRGSAPDIVDDTAKIRQMYLSSWWIWVDVIAALPLRFAFVFGGSSNYDPEYDALGRLQMGRTGCVWCKTEDELRVAVEVAKWIAHVRILKYLRHLTYFHRSGHCAMTKFYIMTQFVIGRALLTISRFICLVHICAIGYLALPLEATYSSGGQIEENTRPHYSQGVFIVLYCFTTVGYGSTDATSERLMYYFIVLVMLGAVVNGYVVANVVEFLSRSDVQSQRKQKISEANALLTYFRVPTGLANELLQYQNHLLCYDLVRAYDGVVGSLPTDFREKLNLYSRARAIRTVPFFLEVHSSAKLELCESLLQVVFVPDESLIAIGDSGEEMFIVNHGFADVVTGGGEYINSYRSGSYFGELGLMSRKPVSRIADVRALTYCDVFILTRPAFSRVMRRYPRLRQRVREVLPELQARHCRLSLDVIDFDLSHLDGDDNNADDRDDDEELIGHCGDAVEAVINAEWLSGTPRSMVKSKVLRMRNIPCADEGTVSSMRLPVDRGGGDEALENLVTALTDQNDEIVALIEAAERFLS